MKAHANETVGVKAPMQLARSISHFLLGLLLLAGLLWTAPELRASDTDPNGLYGHCGNVYRSKSEMVYGLGKTLANVVGIVVLDCHPFDGGGYGVVPCPPNTPYAYCLRNGNDGGGNHIDLGVLELNPTTDPNSQYGGCASGAGFRIKSDVLRGSIALRKIDAIVVTNCVGADGPPGTVKVACPAKSIYTACFVNQDDGVGNHVEFGVIKNFGAGDPSGLYGGFSKTSKFRTKSVLVTEVGRSLDKVASIVTTWTYAARGSGGSQIIPCYPRAPYSYCINNHNDGAGNWVKVGVVERP